jgi:hypothetical protein
VFRSACVETNWSRLGLSDFSKNIDFMSPRHHTKFGTVCVDQFTTTDSWAGAVPSEKNLLSCSGKSVAGLFWNPQKEPRLHVTSKHAKLKL